MKLGIVIPTFNRLTLLRKLIFQIIEYKKLTFDYVIVIVDDGSKDDTKEFLTYLKESYDFVHVIEGTGNWWWSKSFNEGMKFCFVRSDTDYVLSLNDDVEIYDTFFEDLKCRINELNLKHGNQFMFNCGAVDIINRTYVDLGKIKHFYNPFKVKKITISDFKNGEYYVNVNHNHGRGLLIPKSVYKLIGDLDYETFPQYLGDSEYSNRAYRHGFRLYFTLKPYLLSHVDLTSKTKYEKKYSISNFLKRLNDQYSDSNLRMFYLYNKKTKMGFHIYTFTIVDFSKIIFGYIKRWIKASL